MSSSRSSKRIAEARQESVSPPPSKRRFESTTTKKTITSFFTPSSQKVPDPISWRTVNSSLLIGTYNPVGLIQTTDPLTKRRKIAAFDLDSTLIQTLSGNIFSKNPSDWRWWHMSVPSVLKQLYADGYIIAILTNQGSISLRNDPKTLKGDQRNLAHFKAKVASVFAHLDFPIVLLAATARDEYRKPRTRMWHELLEETDLDMQGGPDLSACFFVGDAGGRPARKGAKADHACSDRDFATNVGINFKSPEEFFLDEAPHPFVRDFEPKEFLDESPANASPPLIISKKHPLELVLLCGSPGSGKSTFYWQHLMPLGYERVNQDLLKTRDSCVKSASKLLAEGKPVTVDNTNADVETRAVWIRLAKTFGVPVRCVYMRAPAKLCEHNDTVRALAGGTFNPEKRAILPHSAFFSFASRFKEPQAQEGFEEILSIPFQFQGDPEQRRTWAKYWV